MQLEHDNIMVVPTGQKCPSFKLFKNIQWLHGHQIIVTLTYPLNGMFLFLSNGCYLLTSISDFQHPLLKGL